MKRIIVDYAKLTQEILDLLVEKYPDGYEEIDIVRFKNIQNELIEAVEVRTEDTIYLVKISKKLQDRMINYDDDFDLDLPPEGLVKDIAKDIEEEEEDEDDEDDDSIKKDEFDDDDDDDDDDDFSDDENYDDEDDDDDDKV
jgi:DNA-directed RNA polymerase subunit delta